MLLPGAETGTINVFAIESDLQTTGTQRVLLQSALYADLIPPIQPSGAPNLSQGGGSFFISTFNYY